MGCFRKLKPKSKIYFSNNETIMVEASSVKGNTAFCLPDISEKAFLFKNGIVTAAFSSDDKCFACICMDAYWRYYDTLRIYETDSFDLIFEKKLKDFFHGQFAGMSEIAFLPDNRLIAAFYLDETKESILVEIDSKTLKIKSKSIGNALVEGFLCNEKSAVMLLHTVKLLSVFKHYCRLDLNNEELFTGIENEYRISRKVKHAENYPTTYNDDDNTILIDADVFTESFGRHKKALYSLSTENFTVKRITHRSLKYSDFPFPICLIGKTGVYYGEIRIHVPLKKLLTTPIDQVKRGVFSLKSGEFVGEFCINNNELCYIGKDKSKIKIVDLKDLSMKVKDDFNIIVSFSPTAKYMVVNERKCGFLIETPLKLLKEFSK